MSSSTPTRLSERRREMREELLRMKAQLDDLGEKVPAEIWERHKKASDEVASLEKHMASVSRRLDRLRRSLRREKPSFEAMTVEMPKWRTTILLGLNSAAIVAVIGVKNVDVIFIQEAVLSFSAGALAALASGGVLETMGSTGLALADDLDTIDIDNDETRDEDLNHAEKSSKKVFRYQMISEILRFISLILLAIGILIVSLNLETAPTLGS